jgi:hypothetical protein
MVVGQKIILNIRGLLWLNFSHTMASLLPAVTGIAV